MKLYVLDGIGSHNRTSGVIDKTVDAIKSKVELSEVKWINWEASMMTVGGKLSWNASSKNGIQMLLNEIKKHSEPFVIVAYSGGNKPAHDFLNQYPEYLSRVAAVGFLSDPFRPRDKMQNGVADPGGWGICGEDKTPIPDRAYWCANAGDAISGASPDSLLRTMADLSDGDPQFVLSDAIETLNKNKFQLGYQLKVPFWQWFTTLGTRINVAIAEARGYLTGKHTTEYVIPYNGGASLATRLGDTIAWKIKKGVGV